MAGFDDEDDYEHVADSEEETLADPSTFGDADQGEQSLTPRQASAARHRAELSRRGPRPFVLKESKKRIAVVDTETDPFAYGAVVKPFALGFYDGERYLDWWGDDCIKEFFAYLETCEEQYVIYAHNGGKFDFYFFLDYLVDQTPLIMNGRLVKINFGKQEFRDSYSIIPQALSAYKKDEIDYALFERGRREKHRVKILDYQRTDCVYAYELIAGFHAMFGDKLTIASAALPMLHSMHGFQRIDNDALDAKFRQYFYGGRNQCFETGVLTPRDGAQFIMIDRNSMYPAVMRDCLHPISNTFKLSNKLTKDTDFACIEADNDGALPSRTDDGDLDFTVKRGTFMATIHEINAGLETKTLRIRRVKHAFEFDRKATFAEFVERFYLLRKQAKLEGDKVKDILYKFVLNSSYGKFALNPRKFKQYKMTVMEIADPKEGWQFHASRGEIYIWCRPNPRVKGFYNVATASSITGAARANLLLNLRNSIRPVYCDTDSILCEGYKGELNGTDLGGWKLEATGDKVAIGGKKLYAMFNKGDNLKKASKGVNISPQDIIDVCNGHEVTYQNPVPNFGLDGSARFVTRRINKTGDVWA